MVRPDAPVGPPPSTTDQTGSRSARPDDPAARESDRRVPTGAAALRKASIALYLGLALVLYSLSAAGLVWWITRALLLCHA